MRHFTRTLAANSSQRIAALGRHVHVVRGPPRLKLEARQSSEVEFDVDLGPGEGFTAPWQFTEITVTNPLAIAYQIELQIGDGEFPSVEPSLVTVGASTAMNLPVAAQFGVVKLRALERPLDVLFVSVKPVAGADTEYRFGIERPEIALSTLQNSNEPGWSSDPLVGSRAGQLQSGANALPKLRWPIVLLTTVLRPLKGQPWRVNVGDAFLVQTRLASSASFDVSFVWQEIM